MWQIKKTIIEDLIASSKKMYPDEFLCFLGGDKAVKRVDEIIFLPTTSGETFSSVDVLSIPFDESIIGSFHSHPNGMAFPSKADKTFFHRYFLNLILGLGTIDDVRAFNNEGNEIILDIKE
jgi:proteasome lid subunit RPN8/RPN11